MATETATKTFDIPKKYKAVVYDKPGTISTKIEELDTPEPGAGEVLVRLLVLLEFLQLKQNGLTKG
jgi:propanol-preferring alcohol dehydrogenase